MKKVIIMLSLIVVTGVSACSPDDSPLSQEVPEQPGGNENPENGNNPGTYPADPDNMNMVIKIGSAIFTATLTDNATTKAFKALLPMTVNMNELNRNEKYYDLPNGLPTAASNPETIRNGDIMLYGSRTLVLFYKTFSTSYSYTRIGTVDNPSGLENALGTENITVTFEQQIMY